MKKIARNLHLGRMACCRSAQHSQALLIGGYVAAADSHLAIPFDLDLGVAVAAAGYAACPEFCVGHLDAASLLQEAWVIQVVSSSDAFFRASPELPWALDPPSLVAQGLHGFYLTAPGQGNTHDIPDYPQHLVTLLR